MTADNIKKPSDDLDALLDDALEAFDTEGSIPARLPPSPAPSPANPPGVESIEVARASSSKPSKSNLAFDPLGARGGRKKTPASVEPAPEASAAELSTDEYNEDELNDMSAGLSQLLAELARANIGPGGLGGEDAGPAASQQQEETVSAGAGAGAGAGLAETLRALAHNQAAFSGAEGGGEEGDLENIPNDLLEKLAAQLRGMEGMEGLEGLLPPELLGAAGGGGVNAAAGLESGSGVPNSGNEFPGMASLVDTIMHQLLSKDVLHQPMKDIGNKYPEWLAANKSSLDVEKYKQYEEQYEYIQKICTMYETDPENYPKLMDLLQEMQQRGQPPQEIIDELAPGVTFGPDGLPNMGGGGGGGGMDPSECCE
ncbi:hypothetical protein KSW81_003842 [Nannochloris sp. 'desiccata']|nr:hypothetical protein KSW81_003842 [Chlorella desiccata (nom. nud.)]